MLLRSTTKGEGVHSWWQACGKSRHVFRGRLALWRQARTSGPTGGSSCLVRAQCTKGTDSGPLAYVYLKQDYRSAGERVREAAALPWPSRDWSHASSVLVVGTGRWLHE